MTKVNHEFALTTIIIVVKVAGKRSIYLCKSLLADDGSDDLKEFNS